VAAAEIAVVILAMSKERAQGKPVSNVFQITGTAAVMAYQLCVFSSYS